MISQLKGNFFMRIFRCISARELTNMYKVINDRYAVVMGENTHRYEYGKE